MKKETYQNPKNKQNITFLEEDIAGDFEAIELPDINGGILYHCVGDKKKMKKWKDRIIKENNLTKI